MPEIVRHLEIQNFKSIRHLQLDCRRVNVFIGEPNTGKSNILEALGLLSFPHTGNIRDFVRMERMSDLFHEYSLDREVRVIAPPITVLLRLDRRASAYEMVWEDAIGQAYRVSLTGEGIPPSRILPEGMPAQSPWKFYRFAPSTNFRSSSETFLLPPRGENLPYILLVHRDLREYVGELFERFGLRLVVKPQENQLEVQRELDGIVLSLPYALVSDTLQRLVFHIAAIETNRESILIFEEPEAHAFPFYTKYLAERIARDASNQYFISTHNPFLLVSLLEKAPADDLAVFVTYLRDYRTEVKGMVGKELERVLDLEADVFLNLDSLLEGV